MMLSDCCFKPAGVYVPMVRMCADSPPDPIEYCTECDHKCEPIDHDCPAEEDPWEAECHIFAEYHFFCPFAAIPFLDERHDWPPCPWQNEV